VGGAVPLQHAQRPVAEVGGHAAMELDALRGGNVDPLLALRGRVARGGDEVGQDVGRRPVIAGVEVQQAREQFVVGDLPLLNEEPARTLST